MRRHLFIAIAASLALLAIGLIAYQWVEQPTTLRVAVGPLGSEDTRLVTAINQYLAREHSSLRLKLVMTEEASESARALDEDRADLAIVRSDIGLPVKGQTVAIMHKDAAVLITVPETGIKAVGDLKGRSVGIVRRVMPNRRLLDRVLAQYDVPTDTVTTVSLAAPMDATEALRTRRVDAVLYVGTVAGRSVSDTVSAVAQAGDGSVVFLPIGEANVIAQRSPWFETAEIVRGTFGGMPARPTETVPTLGVSTRLVVQSKLDDGTVAELTRQLFLMRPAISSEVPLANRIEGPSTSKSSSMPTHPGAAAYYDGEIQTFFERYSDWFYFGVMVLSILGSGVATVASNAAGRARARHIALLSELLAIVRTARDAQTEEELEDLEREADDILGTALAKAGGGGLDNAGVAAFTLGLDQARRALAERRKVLLAHGPPSLSQAAE
jgi:TRAP transporter TAXI family solute receptor